MIQLASKAFIEGYYYKPRIDWELLDEHSEGSSPHRVSRRPGPAVAAAGQLRRGGATAGRLQDIFGRDNLFIELQDHGIPEQHRTNPQLLEIAKKIGAPILATNDSHYTHQADHARTTRCCVCRPARLRSDPDRFKFHGDQHYLKTRAEMRHMWREVEVACDNSPLDRRAMQRRDRVRRTAAAEFPAARGFDDDDDYLLHLTMEGAKKRWGDNLPDESPSASSFELDVIKNMGFSSYFIITWDLIKYARDNDIRVGPVVVRLRVRGCLLPVDHRPRSHQVRPAVRAIPQPVAHLDARHRHGLRLPLPRRDDPLLRRAVRPRSRRPDRHVQPDQGPSAYATRPGCSATPTRSATRSPRRCRRSSWDATPRCSTASRNTRSTRRVRTGRRAARDGATDRSRRSRRGGEGPRGPASSDGIHAAARGDYQGPLTDYLPIQRKPESGQDPEDAPVVTQYEMNGVESLGLLKMDFPGAAQPRRHRRHAAD